MTELFSRSAYIHTQVVRSVHDDASLDAHKRPRGAAEAFPNDNSYHCRFGFYASVRARVSAVSEHFHIRFRVRAPLADSHGGSLSTSLGLRDGLRRGWGDRRCFDDDQHHYDWHCVDRFSDAEEERRAGARESDSLGAKKNDAQARI